MTLLTICIPTYNRGHFLPETLNSIVREWQDDLEITVSDNASTDSTAEIVATYQQRYGAVRYFRWDQNQGADRNYLKCVELASGRYCLILGSDDALAPGAVAALKAQLQSSEPSICLFNRHTCDQDMHPLRREPFLRVGTQSFDLSTPAGKAAYLRQGRSLCAAFSYLSSVVFRKSDWDAVETVGSFIGSAYIHTQKLMVIFQHRAMRLDYLDKALVYCRLGFDSFREQGLARRVLLDLEGYDFLIQRYFSQDPNSAAEIRRLVREEYPFGRLLRYQGVAGQEAAWPEALRQLKEHYSYGALPIRLATTLGRSRRLVSLSFLLRDAGARWRQT